MNYLQEWWALKETKYMIIGALSWLGGMISMDLYRYYFGWV